MPFTPLPLYVFSATLTLGRCVDLPPLRMDVALYTDPGPVWERLARSQLAHQGKADDGGSFTSVAPIACCVWG